ncbi:MAG: hypothetical protein M3R17_16785 [Bacteroidota bacterium]|nr:hypothetical protein [Bacteroidota bacterium]
MKRLLIFMCILTAIAVQAQNRKPNRNVGGQFSLGVRSTASLFSGDGNGIGTGAGGQFRIRFYDFMNSEWFADYVMSDYGSTGTRTDYHIGWSVMFYAPTKKAFKKYRPKPYFLAGHCFDYTRVQGNNPFYQVASSASRWSSAVQTGFGMHIPFSDRVDLSFSGQYMIHLGKDIFAEERTAANGDKFLHAEIEDNAGLDGHLFLTCSLNFRIADLWRDHGKGGGAGKSTPDPDGQNPNYTEQ